MIQEDNSLILLNNSSCILHGKIARNQSCILALHLSQASFLARSALQSILHLCHVLLTVSEECLLNSLPFDSQTRNWKGQYECEELLKIASSQGSAN